MFKMIAIEKSEGSFSGSGELTLSHFFVHLESSVFLSGSGRKKNVMLHPMPGSIKQ